jgi:APA family basic amino acid/polyamine antiporter
MIASEGWENWARLIVWLLIGFVIYFRYSVKHSKVRTGGNVTPGEPINPKYVE